MGFGRVPGVWGKCSKRKTHLKIIELEENLEN
jgi:hypothetical protein